MNDAAVCCSVLTAFWHRQEGVAAVLLAIADLKSLLMSVFLVCQYRSVLSADC